MKSNAFRAIFKNNEGFSSKIIFILMDRENCLISGWENSWETIDNASLIGEDFGLEASSDRSSSKMRLARHQRLMMFAIATWKSTFFGLNRKTWLWTTRGFNKTVPHSSRNIQSLHESCNQKSLAGQIVRFNAVGIFFEVQDSCRSRKSSHIYHNETVIKKKFIIFNRKPVFSIKIISYVNFGTPFIYVSLDNLTRIRNGDKKNIYNF